MNRYIAILLIILCLPAFALANEALQVLPGTGYLDTDQGKLFHFRYHNMTDDFHLSAPSKWGIRFNFKEAFPVADSSSFNLQAIRMFSPLANMNLRLSLADDQSASADGIHYVYFPGTTVYADSIITTTGNPQDVFFSNVPDSLLAVWLVIEIQQPLTGKYLSASTGSGEHSYFFNTTGPGGSYWQSLNEAGFGCELRFGALGSFNLENPRLELLNLGFQDPLQPDSQVTPVCTVFNHGSSPLSGILNIEITDPSLEFNQLMQIQLASIPANDSLFAVADSSFTLPRDPTQLKAMISLSYNGYTGTAFSQYFEVFIDHGGKHVIEHFRRSNDAVAGIPVSIDTLALHLMFFPNLADSLSNLAAVQKYDFYQFSTLPKTVVDGSIRFQMPTSQTDLLSAVEQAKQRKTFISRGTCSVRPDSVNADNWHINLNLYNDHTKLFEWSGSSVINPRLFIGLFKAQEFAGNTRFVIQRWLSFNEQLSTTLDSGTSFSKTLSINMANTDQQDVYRVYYWLQNLSTNGGQMYYADFAELTNASSTSDEFIPVPKICLYPNPLRGSGDIKISNFTTPSVISIYNLRGQKIFTRKVSTAELNLSHSLFPSSGIYFLRSESTFGNQPQTQTYKFSIIK